MEPRYLTISRQDPEFAKFVLGNFSKDQLAVPTGSYNTRTKNHSVTFKLVDRPRLSLWDRGLLFFASLRPHLLSMILGPVLFSLVDLLHTGTVFQWQLAATSLISLGFLHLAVFLFNDYFDHVRGSDQINRSQQGHRLIQNGKVSAHQIRSWAALNFTLGVLFGLPALLAKPLVVGPIGAFAVITILGFSKGPKSWQNRGIGEILISICLGPLLVVGYMMTVAGEVSPTALAVGVLLGWWSSLIFQTKYLEEMVTTYQNRQKSLIQRLGFDRGKKFIQFQLVAYPLVAVGAFAFTENFWPLVLTAPFLITITSFLSLKIRRAVSPMSSSLIGLSQVVTLLHGALVLIFSLTLVLVS